MEYSFDVEVATRYGVRESVLLKNIGFWLSKNFHNRKHFHDSRYWTYNSYRAFGKLYPFWTPKQIRTALDHLVDAEVLIKGNFNIKGYDKTNWYSIIDEWVIDKYVTPLCPGGQYPLPVRADASAQEGKPIPDVKPDENDTVTSKSDRKNLRILFFELYQKKATAVRGTETNNEGKPWRPPWAAKENSLLLSDHERVGTKELRNAMLLFFADAVKDTAQFCKKAGYTYAVFHGVIEKLVLSDKSLRVCDECLGIGGHKSHCSFSKRVVDARRRETIEAARIREENPEVDLKGMFKKVIKSKTETVSHLEES